MEIITSEFELAAVGGGYAPSDKIKCKVGSSGVNCEGSLSDFIGTLTQFGAWLGCSIYDWTH